MIAIGAAGALAVRWILRGGGPGAATSSAELAWVIFLGGALGTLTAILAFAWQDKSGWFSDEPPAQ